MPTWCSYSVEFPLGKLGKVKKKAKELEIDDILEIEETGVCHGTDTGRVEIADGCQEMSYQEGANCVELLAFIARICKGHPDCGNQIVELGGEGESAIIVITDGKFYNAEILDIHFTERKSRTNGRKIFAVSIRLSGRNVKTVNLRGTITAEKGD